VSDDYLIAEYRGLKVAWQPELAGGGRAVAQDYARLVSHLFGRVGRLLEICAGPGFIGFYLLAHGHCDHLVLSDVNPRAIDAIRETIRLNDLGDRVSVYESDGLDSIPDSERWDLVVANPPNWSVQLAGAPSLVTDDPGWRLHRNFYQRVGEFLAPGGSVLIQENTEGNTPEDFLTMIADGGLTLVRTLWYVETSPWANFYYMWIKKAMPGMVLGDPAPATLSLRDPVDGHVEGPAAGPVSLRLVNETGRSVVPHLVDNRGASVLWLPLGQMPTGADMQLPFLSLKPGEYEVRDISSTGEQVITQFSHELSKEDTAQAVTVARLTIG
jgi:SAM-dependent methyltransferase